MKTLRQVLSEAMSPSLALSAPVWGDPAAMSLALCEVRKALSDVDIEKPQDDVLQRSLRKFVETQDVASFMELKHVCYGVTVPVGSNNWSVIDQEPLFHRLLHLVDRQSAQAKQFRRCYHGLLTGYFGFEKLAATTKSQKNWLSLCSYLDSNLRTVLSASSGRGLKIDWLETLAAHRNLLTADPCSRYAQSLRQGRPEELHSVCASLGVANTSWVWDEALMAYVAAVCAEGDANFQRDMPGVLNLVNGRLDLRLAQLLGTRATAMTVSRYAACVDKPEHADLRDTSLRCVGNPWLQRTAWDAHVQNESARQMVESWIKRRLIKDFFELMAHDGGADLRRLNYWLQREPEITNMWFVLGSDARANRSAAFEELRERMTGRRRSLEDPNAQNNAFVMRIGPLLVIEFGVTGNACYVFAASDFRGDLDQESLSIYTLKQRAGATRLSHAWSWEQRFDYELRRLLQSVPHSKGELAPRPSASKAPVLPAHESIQQAIAKALAGTAGGLTKPSAQSAAKPLTVPVFLPGAARRHGLNESQTRSVIASCKWHGVLWEDNRPKNGAFWVLIQDRDRHLQFSSELETQGFAYAQGKGYWIKD